MKFYIPQELTDPLIHERRFIPHGEGKPINILAIEVELVRVGWLNEHPGWSYSGTRITRCADGTPPPCYDVAVEFQRPQTPAEREKQDENRAEYIRQKEQDFRRREEEQKALLEEVLRGIRAVPNRKS